MGAGLRWEPGRSGNELKGRRCCATTALELWLNIVGCRAGILLASIHRCVWSAGRIQTTAENAGIWSADNISFAAENRGMLGTDTISKSEHQPTR